MKDPKAIVFFVSLFLIFQLITTVLTPQVQTYQNNFITPFWVIIWVILGTVFFLFLMRHKRIKITKSWIMLSYFIATFFAFAVFLNELLAILLAALIIILRYKFKNKVMHNVGELIAYFGIVQMFVQMFSPITVVILVLLLAIYDLISVYITKHMLKLVKTSSKTGFVPAIIFSKTPSMLGGGDFIFPAIYSSTMWAYGLHIVAAVSAISATIGLLFLLLIGKKKKAYPALPSIVSFMYIGTIIALITSFFF